MTSRTRVKLIAQIIGLGILGISQLSFVVYLGFLFFEPLWLTYPELPFKIERVVDAEGHLVKPVWHAGDNIRIVAKRCNNSGQTRAYLITREIANTDFPDKSIMIAASTSIQIRPGCTEGISGVNKLPDDIAPGHYRAQGLAYVEGKIRSEWIPWYTEDFEVVAR